MATLHFFCLVGGVEKWEDRKWWEGGKVRGYKRF